ncbi:hypothetical protein D3C87_985800 [compost metagenome]
MDIFPFPSSNVQVTTVVPCAVIGKTVDVVPIIMLEQFTAVAGAASVTSHSPVISGRLVGTCIALFRITF